MFADTEMMSEVTIIIINNTNIMKWLTGIDSTGKYSLISLFDFSFPTLASLDTEHIIDYNKIIN